MSEIVTVGKGTSIMVPKAIRKELGIVVGQKVLVRAQGTMIVIELLPKDPYASLSRIIGAPYNEKRDSGGAEKWLMKQAGRPSRSKRE